VRHLARTPVRSHDVIRVVLDNGARLEMSAGHPTVDRRRFGDLKVGDRLDSANILAVERVRYGHAFTYDLLPASDSGVYFAGGVAVDSSLNP
jgi:hypothetical protein